MVLCSGNKCGRFFCSEFHYSKLCLFYEDWRAFTYIPWLPYRWYSQLFYVFYRWAIAIYTIVWLVLLGRTSETYFFIFLTNWSFLILNLYLVWSALTTTIEFFKVHVCFRKDNEDVHIRDSSDYEIETPRGCCGAQSNGIRWYHMIQWLLFTVATDAAFLVTFLYWTLLFPLFRDLSALNVNVHLVNSIVALLDFWVAGLPVNLLHLFYTQAIGSVYVVFTGVYYAANGTNPIDNERYVYPVLDYGERPASASLASICVVLFLVPIIHIVLYAQYAIRYWLVYAIYGRRERTGSYYVRHTD